MKFYQPILIAVICSVFTACKTEPQKEENMETQELKDTTTVEIPTKRKMKVFSGIITEKLKESKEFYTTVLDFKVVFENDFFLLMESPSGEGSFSFLLPNHPSQQPIFQSAFNGKGAYITIEVEDADAEYNRIKDLGIPIEVEIRDEVWGDRHFAIVDPNGIGIDIVKYTPPAQTEQN
jgi:catechol 2,3-dioxygenase-like lactoylglutathione lyase family enzyme